MRIHRLSWLKSIGALLVACFSGPDANAAVPAAVQTILAAAEMPSEKALRTAEEALKSLGATPNVTATYALALANIANHKYGPAAELLKALPEASRRQPNVRRALFWLAVAAKEKDTDRLHKELDSIAEGLLAKSKAKPEAIIADDLEMAGFFGQMLIYLEEVQISSARVTPKRVKELRIRLERELSPPLREAMTAKAKPVSDKVKAQQEQFEKAYESWRKIRQREIDGLNDELAAVMTEFDTARAAADKAEEEYQAACQPHLKEWTRLQADVRSLSGEIDSIKAIKEPKPPQPDLQTGKTTPEQDRQYRQAQSELDRERRRIPTLEREKQSATNALKNIDALVAPHAKARSEAAAALKGKQDQMDAIQRQIDRKTSDLTRGTGWQSPTARTTFEAITTCEILRVADEVARIRAAYGN